MSISLGSNWSSSVRLVIPLILINMVAWKIYEKINNKVVY